MCVTYIFSYSYLFNRNFACLINVLLILNIRCVHAYKDRITHHEIVDINSLVVEYSHILADHCFLCDACKYKFCSLKILYYF